MSEERQIVNDQATSSGLGGLHATRNRMRWMARQVECLMGVDKSIPVGDLVGCHVPGLRWRSVQDFQVYFKYIAKYLCA